MALTGADWLQSLGTGSAALEMLQRVQRQQDRANKAAGYAVARPSQALMDWVKQWITKQEKDKMGVLNEPKETEVP